MTEPKDSEPKLTPLFERPDVKGWFALKNKAGEVKYSDPVDLDMEYRPEGVSGYALCIMETKGSRGDSFTSFVLLAKDNSKNLTPIGHLDLEKSKKHPERVLLETSVLTGFQERGGQDFPYYLKDLPKHMGQARYNGMDVDGLYIKDQFQRKGFGEFLWAFGRGYMGMSGVKEVIVFSDTTGLKEESFYNNQGKTTNLRVDQIQKITKALNISSQS